MRNDARLTAPIIFQNKVSAIRDLDGRVSGTIESMTSFRERPVHEAITATVTCMLVDGKDAWIGAVITESSFAGARVGESYLLLVRDLGGPGADIMHGELAEPIGHPSCTDRPGALAQTTVDLGNYRIGAGLGPATEMAGTIRLTVSTAGFDRDPDGYDLVIDGWRHPVALNGTLTLSSLLTPGSHTVRLEGMAPNCVVSGQNSRTVTVGASKTDNVVFAVDCHAVNGVLRLTTSTTGMDLDPNGYLVIVDDGVKRAPVAVNDTITIDGLTLGSHTVRLEDIRANCAFPDSARQTVSFVRSGEIVDLRFIGVCAPLGNIRITVVTTGTDFDADGYRVTAYGRLAIGYAQSRIAGNSPVTLGGLPAGEYHVVVDSIAANCHGAGLSRDGVMVPSGGTVALTFEIACWPVTRVAYVAAAPADTTLDIYTVNSDGTAVARLTSHPGMDVDPAWSPDGEKIAFTTDRDGGARAVYVMNADGSNQVRLTDGSAPSYRPAWSPDGSRIAFVRAHAGSGEIYVMNADGTNPVRLTDHAARDIDPAWSPDGRRIAFSSDRDGNPEIYVMNADGSGVQRLTTFAGWDGHPAWSPDGQFLAFARTLCFLARHGNTCYQAVFVTNLSGTDMTERGMGEEPDWSPDGNKIAVTGFYCDFYYRYGAPPCDVSGIEVLNLFGGAVDPVSKGIHHNPTWQPIPSGALPARLIRRR